MGSKSYPGEFEIIGPDTVVLKIEDWGSGGKEPPMVAAPSWEQIETHLRNLENRSMTLTHKDCCLEISGHRTKDSFAKGADLESFILMPDTFHIFAFPPDSPMLVGSPMVGSDHFGLEDTLRLTKIFFESGTLDPTIKWEGPDE